MYAIVEWTREAPHGQQPELRNKPGTLELWGGNALHFHSVLLSHERKTKKPWIYHFFLDVDDYWTQRESWQNLLSYLKNILFWNLLLINCKHCFPSRNWGVQTFAHNCKYHHHIITVSSSPPISSTSFRIFPALFLWMFILTLIKIIRKNKQTNKTRLFDYFSF